MGKIISASKLANKKYNELDFQGKWRDSFGTPEQGSKWLIYGKSGGGKTEFAMQLSKYFTEFGKVFYLSREQGDSSSLQKCILRNELQNDKKINIGVGYSFNIFLELMKKKRGIKTIVIDSLDYLQLSKEQYKVMTETLKKKNIIMISWAENGKPQSSTGRAIEYMVDVKIKVDKYLAIPRSRYGGNTDFIIWEQGAKKYYSHLNR